MWPQEKECTGGSVDHTGRVLHKHALCPFNAHNTVRQDLLLGRHNQTVIVQCLVGGDKYRAQPFLLHNGRRWATSDDWVSHSMEIGNV